VARRKARTRSVIKPIHRLHDHAMDAVRVSEDIVIPKAQHVEAV
jgi:hypothetical protein